jgi:hypothetical protein
MRVSMQMLKLVVAAALVTTAVPAFGQSDAKKSDDEKAMEAMMAAAAPGEQHKLLGGFAGRWNLTTKIWTAPGQPATESSGVSEVTSVLEGRFVQESFKGELMGMPFMGLGLSGYDNVTKKFQSTWVDNMGTGVLIMKGDYDAASKTLTYIGEYANPAGGMTTMKIVQKLIDKDKHVSEFYDKTPDGQVVKIMEITYARAK